MANHEAVRSYIKAINNYYKGKLFRTLDMDGTWYQAEYMSCVGDTIPARYGLTVYEMQDLLCEAHEWQLECEWRANQT